MLSSWWEVVPSFMRLYSLISDSTHSYASEEVKKFADVGSLRLPPLMNSWGLTIKSIWLPPTTEMNFLACHEVTQSCQWLPGIVRWAWGCGWWVGGVHDLTTHDCSRNISLHVSGSHGLLGHSASLTICIIIPGVINNSCQSQWWVGDQRFESLGTFS